MAANATTATPLKPIQERATVRMPRPTMKGAPSRTMYPLCCSMLSTIQPGRCSGALSVLRKYRVNPVFACQLQLLQLFLFDLFLGREVDPLVEILQGKFQFPMDLHVLFQLAILLDVSFDEHLVGSLHTRLLALRKELCLYHKRPGQCREI